MSVFSNGGYVPEGMDFGEWLEYLNGIDEYEAFQDYLEFLEEEEEEYPDDLLIPTLSDESIASLKTVAAGAFQEIERSFADMSTDQKLSSLDELMDLNRKRLLFDYIKQDDEFGFKVDDPPKIAGRYTS